MAFSEALFWKLFFLSFLCLGFILISHGQEHRSPADGANGIPGQISGSFVISWEEVADAESYEYVLTDNSQCFEGCAGDTRSARQIPTSALEFDLREGAFYYWITRVFYRNGDSTGWSKISSFRAISPSAEGLIRIFPNPASPSQGGANIRIDWGADPEASEVSLRLADANGKLLWPTAALGPDDPSGNGSNTFRRASTFVRYEDIPLNLDAYPSALYFLLFTTSRRNKAPEISTQKLIWLQD